MRKSGLGAVAGIVLDELRKEHVVGVFKRLEREQEVLWLRGEKVCVLWVCEKACCGCGESLKGGDRECVLR